MYNDTIPPITDQVPEITALHRASYGRIVLSVVLALTLATATFFSGLHIGTMTQGQSLGLSTLLAGDVQPAPDADLKEFWRVWALLDQKFATASDTAPLSTEDKVRGAIDGLVRSYGDPYTTYFPPKEAQSFGEQIAGNFSGVGMEVGLRAGVITVIAPLPGTPADKAGIVAGDFILSINGTSTENMSIDEAVSHIRGEAGTVVTLKIARVGAGAPLEIKITRAPIEIPTTKVEKRGDTYIIALYSFNALSEAKMQEAFAAYATSGAKKLVLDLRGNPGGYLQSAVAIASDIMPAGKVVVRESFADGRPEEVYRTSGHTVKQFSNNEMVVLIDGGSASASEILAGALAEQGYAKLVGTDSFGKGSVQELTDLPSGASVKITVARWLTPNGTSISHAGLKPDVVVTRTLDDRTAGKDPQLDAAIAVLHGTYVAPKATSTAPQQ